MLHLLAVAAACGISHPPMSLAMSMNGVAIYAVDQTGEPNGPFWHTSLDPSGRPIAITRWNPQGVRGIPFLNDPASHPDGEFNIDLFWMSHETTTLWQYNPGEFPQWVVLNIFFNGDNLNPGISAIVPFERGFTLFTTNPNPTTLSLYGRDVQNPQTLIYDDGGASARLGVAYYYRSGVPDDVWMWRPSDLTNLDRVGTEEIAPDGQADAVLIFELVVGPSQQPPPGPLPSRATGFGAVSPPLTANIGPDLWVAPDKPPLEEGTGTQQSAPAEATVSEPTPVASDVGTAAATPAAASTGATPPPPTPEPTIEHGAPTPHGSRTPERTPTQSAASAATVESPTPSHKAWWR